MTYSVLGLAFLLFVFSLIIHLVMWRLFNVQREIRLLLTIFLAIPFFSFVLWSLAGSLERWRIFAIAIAYFSLAIFYVQTYPILKRDIPSFRILFLLGKNKNEGLLETEIIDAFRGDLELFDIKVEELQKDALVMIKPDGHLALTGGGQLLATLFIFYRRLLGLGEGQG